MIEDKQKMDAADVEIISGAEEFTLGDGPVGALLVHGYTGSPQGMRALGDSLADAGIAVSAPRLPGHGTTWEDLNRRTAGEWMEAVEAAFHEVSAEREEVFVVALSFGAALCLDLAAHHPDEIDGLVTLAGWVQSKDPRRFAAPLIKRIVKSLPGVGNDIADPEGREIAYDRLPTASTHQALRMIKRARSNLGAVRCPILIMHGRNDHTVLPFNAGVIFNSVSSTDKEIVWLENSYHVLTLDRDREEVFRRTLDFIKARSKHAL